MFALVITLCTSFDFRSCDTRLWPEGLFTSARECALVGEALAAELSTQEGLLYTLSCQSTGGVSV